MISNSYSKKNQSGQALLMMMMLIATALTIFLSMSFKSTTETQVTKLEEEAQKALAAAEAGIEAALKEGTVTIGQGSLSSFNSGFSGSATCSESYDKTYFVSPLLQKDEQYTFYLSDYPGLTNSYTGSLVINYGSQTTCADVSLELTLIYGNNQIKRWVADSADRFSTNPSFEIYDNLGNTVGGVSFNCKTSSINIGSYNNAKLLFIRTFNAPTQLGFVGTTTLKPQGKLCDADVKSSTVSKKLYLLQSYPQIPAEFFVTSF